MGTNDELYSLILMRRLSLINATVRPVLVSVSRFWFFLADPD